MKQYEDLVEEINNPKPAAPSSLKKRDESKKSTPLMSSKSSVGLGGDKKNAMGKIKEGKKKGRKSKILLLLGHFTYVL